MYDVVVHLYADDTQLYVSFDIKDPDNLATAKSYLEKCIAHVCAWLKENKLKLNKDKTEVNTDSQLSSKTMLISYFVVDITLFTHQF